MYGDADTLEQGFSNCGMRTISDTRATVNWYTGLVREYPWIKFLNKCDYIENLINFIFHLNT
jgi:hypothetical protein